MASAHVSNDLRSQNAPPAVHRAIPQLLSRHKKAIVATTAGVAATTAAAVAVCGNLPLFMSPRSGNRSDYEDPLTQIQTWQHALADGATVGPPIEKYTTAVIIYGDERIPNASKLYVPAIGHIDPDALKLYVPQAGFAHSRYAAPYNWVGETKETAKAIAQFLVQQTNIRTYICVGLAMGSLGASYFVKELSVARTNLQPPIRPGHIRPEDIKIVYISVRGTTSIVNAAAKSFEGGVGVGRAIVKFCKPVRTLLDSIVLNLEYAREHRLPGFYQFGFGLVHAGADVIISKRPQDSDTLIDWVRSHGGPIYVPSNEPSDDEYYNDAFYRVLAAAEEGTGITAA